MFCNGHTLETMFANKLVAATARYTKNKRVAGRDFYDIHMFFQEGISINSGVIKEATGKDVGGYLQYLGKFIEKHIDSKMLVRDLNPLVPNKKLHFIQNHLRDELLFFINTSSSPTPQKRKTAKHPLETQLLVLGD